MKRASSIALSTALFFWCFASMGAEQKQSTSHLNKVTGEVFWNLDGEVGLKYIPNCVVDNHWGGSFEQFMRGMDLFSIIGYQKLTSVECGGRGLRPIYLLREDGLFPVLFNKTITINNNRLNYYNSNYSQIAHMADSENYQHLYAALQRNKPAAAAVYASYYTLDHERPQVEVVLDTSILDMADKINKENALTESNRINDEIYRKFWIVSLINSVIFICFALGMLRMYRKAKKPLSKLFFLFSRASIRLRALVQKVGLKESSIIKSEGLKPYSVADELLKWASLKDAGLVSDEEFKEARNKIMGK